MLLLKLETVYRALLKVSGTTAVLAPHFVLLLLLRQKAVYAADEAAWEEHANDVFYW